MRLTPGTSRRRPDVALRAAAGRLEATGASLCVELPGAAPIRIGTTPERARVVFRSARGLEHLRRGDHLALAEAHLAGEIDIEGDIVEVMKVAAGLALAAGPLDRLRLGLRLALRDRIAYDRESIAFHYDRPPEFFLPWLDRWRCYSHGIYAAADEPIAVAMARKMQRAIEALGLRPGMDVLDMGAGWGCFVEYAGLQGIRVHGITISETQYRFVRDLIAEKGLPCEIELVNFAAYHPRLAFDGAVFMGTFEHNPEYDRAARFLAEHLKPTGRVWADFCAQRTDFTLGRFMKKHIWPGPITYVNPYRLVRELIVAGFNIHELRDDTLHYACTIKAWGDALDANRAMLAARFGEPAVRAFLLFLRGSLYFLSTNRTQAYHLVAARDPAPVGPGS